MTDNAPAEPEELRIDVYSPTALEVFWARWVLEDVAGYEVARDGVVLDPLRDGLSFFDSDLLPGQVYLYSVTTINSQGVRSPAVSLFVRMPDNGVTAAPLVSEPEGFTGVEYASNLLELFWERPAIPVLRYDVLRDGELIGSTDGVSFLDQDYIAGEVSFYQVVAVSADGLSSPAAKWMLATNAVVASPANVTIFLYSATAAELIWDRPPEGSVMKTEVYRDDVLLQVVTGNSYFDGNRTPGATSQYKLIAYDFNLQPSAPTVVSVEPF
ncbi:MAG: hypothetical protein KTR33_01770 [Gammaproteobacteria bacterium]|nr:hypothetical protein [Gammaproteobacteria bacterium]